MSADPSRLAAGRLFVVFSQGTADLTPHVPAHVEYLVGLEKEGRLLMAGPFLRSDGTPAPRGMLLVWADDRAAAEALAAADPFHSSGARSFHVEEWQVHQGRIGIEIDLSDRSYRLR